MTNTNDFREERCIEELGVSTRLYNCFKRAGINTVKDIEAREESDFDRIRNFGNACKKELKSIPGINLKW